MAASEEQFLSLEDVANRLQVSDQTVRRWVKSGKLTAYKPGLEYRIREADLEEFLRAREVRPKAPRRSPLELSLLNGLEEERRASSLIDLLELSRSFYEVAVARWLRAIERGTVLESPESAGAFAAGAIEQATHALGVITHALIPAAEGQLTQAEAERERKALLETESRIEESMLAVVGAVEGIAGPGETAAAELIRRYLDPKVLRALDEKSKENADRPDFELWLRREKRRRREAGAKAAPQEKPAEAERKHPTA